MYGWGRYNGLTPATCRCALFPLRHYSLFYISQIHSPPLLLFSQFCSSLYLFTRFTTSLREILRRCYKVSFVSNSPSTPVPVFAISPYLSCTCLHIYSVSVSPPPLFGILYWSLPLARSFLFSQPRSIISSRS